MLLIGLVSLVQIESAVLPMARNASPSQGSAAQLDGKTNSIFASVYDTRSIHKPKHAADAGGKSSKHPSGDTVEKLIDSVGLVEAAAQLGVDIATLEQSISTRSISTDEAKHAPGKSLKHPSGDTIQKLIDSVGLVEAAAQLGVDVTTLEQSLTTRSIIASHKAKPGGGTGKSFKLPSHETIQKLIDSIGLVSAAAELGVDAATLEQSITTRSIIASHKSKQGGGTGKSFKLPSHETIQKLIDSIGLVSAAAELGVDATTLEQSLATRSIIASHKPKGATGKSFKLPSHKTIQKLTDFTGLADTAAELGVDVTTLEQSS